MDEQKKIYRKRKKFIYLFEIIISVAAIIAAALHWYYLYGNNYAYGAFFHIAAFLAYGIFVIIRIVQMFSKNAPLHRSMLILFFGCILLIVAFILSFSSGSAFSIPCSLISLVIFFLSARNIRGRAFIKLIVTFIILTAILYVSAFFLGIAETSPINISELSQNEIRIYNFKMFLKSVGGAATYCFIPVLAAFWLTDIFTEEMLLENDIRI